MSRQHDTNRATVVSFVPFPIVEEKPGIYPGYFHIPPSKGGIPQILVVGTSVYHVEIDPDRGSITVPCSPNEMARSIVEDYLVSNLEFFHGDEEEPPAMPAIFWLPGVHTAQSVMLQNKPKVDEALEYQRNWFQRLVKLADDDWERTRQHRAITNMQRTACKMLDLDRPWVIVPTKDAKQAKCFACRSVIDPSAIVCANCKAILDPEKYKTIQFAGVK